MSGLIVFQYILLSITALLVCYYTTLSIIYFLTRNKEVNEFLTTDTRKFAVLIFVEEQSDNISRSLYSLSGVVYSKNKYDLFVITKERNNDIYQLAENMGAKVLESLLNQKTDSKGRMVVEALEAIRQEDNYDAVILLGSNSLISGNFLEVMNYYLEQGNELIQANCQRLPTADKLEEQIYGVEFLLNNIIPKFGRKKLGLESPILNYGICIRMEVFDEFPWQLKTYPSIVEYLLYLRLRGVEITFAPESTLYTDKSKPNNQTSDWFNTRGLIRRHVSQIGQLLFKERSLKYLDIISLMMVPKFTTILFLVAIIALINIAFWGWGLISTSMMTAWLILASVGFGSAAAAIYDVGVRKNILKYFFKCAVVTARRLLDKEGSDKDKKIEQKKNIKKELQK